MNFKIALNELDQKYLYKYRAIDWNNTDYVSRIFTHSEIYFPSPGQLNDIWDCKPNIVVGNLGSILYRRKFNRYLVRLLMATNPTKSQREIKRWVKELPIKDHASLIAEYNHSLIQNLEDVWRIYSLSSIPDNNLMWSHYSEGHTGICLEFDASTEIFGGAMKVEYFGSRPELDFLEQNNGVLLRHAVLMKSEDWKYEGEYRIVAKEPREFDMLNVVNGKFVFPEQLLKSVILGCRTDKKTEMEIRSWCENRKSNIEFKKTIQDSNSGTLKVTPI